MTLSYPEMIRRRTRLLRQARAGSATQAVRQAIRDGRLKPQPCEICERRPNVQAHHDDYREPLRVRWLCPECHAEWHQSNEPTYLPGWEDRFRAMLLAIGIPEVMPERPKRGPPMSTGRSRRGGGREMRAWSSPEEHARFVAAADACQIPPSYFLRLVVLTAVDRVLLEGATYTDLFKDRT